jgi:hypothetical protein
MAVDGKPGIATVRDAGRAAQGAFDAIRRRIEALEKLLNTVELMSGTSSQKNATVTASLSFLQSQINNIVSDIKELTDLLSGDDGIVVVASGQLLPRTLEAGSGIEITFPDGADGNPVIGLTGAGAGTYPFITTELDDDILTESGHRIRIEG